MKPFCLRFCLATLFCLTIHSLSINAAERFVSFNNGDFLLNKENRVRINLDNSDCRGVDIATQNLINDIKKVCNADVRLTSANEANIIIGTLSHSKEIDRLVKQNKNLANNLQGKHEKFIINNIDNKIIIAGSDRRGTIYGIYELSRQIGVSPWYWWADTPIENHKHIYINKGVYTDGEPTVRYRGIFLNDEAPCLTSWVKNTYGTEYGGHDFYARVFELILRLRGNMLWPAMWGWAFYADDIENSKTADKMGIIIGTSHHEPMARNHQEWAQHRNEYGAWNYKTNKKVLDDFFQKGIERMKGTEDIVTIGMRGDGDEAMSKDADTRLLLDIVASQRRIIKNVTQKPADKTPQVWALYKEVMDYYDAGMRVPEDVTLLLCDDNWGNIRRVPNSKERNRKGGWGLYYHVDYVGAPRNTKWLNVTPTQNMWEQLSLAYNNGIDRMWILNVGDLKPMEFPISQFMDMAWKPDTYTAYNITDYTRKFCSEQFGETQANEAARILNLCCKYAGRCTAEMLNKNTYNIDNGEWQKVVNEYTFLENDALRQFITLPEKYHDVYREIVLFPIQAMGNIYKMYYAQAMNHKLYNEQNPDANMWAEQVMSCFKRDSILCDEYNHSIANGKWNGMMTQKHIGYKSWNDDFKHDECPEVHLLDCKPDGNIFTSRNGVVAIEAAHYYSNTTSKNTVWTEIPFMGRTLSGITLLPNTLPTTGATINYKFIIDKEHEDVSDVNIHIIVKSTLDYLNKGGLSYKVSLDGGNDTIVNFNEKLNEKPENIYNIYYPTIAQRVIESVIKLPLTSQKSKQHVLTISPCDPGIVFEKIVIDLGGYQKSYLFMDESPRRQAKR